MRADQDGNIEGFSTSPIDTSNLQLYKEQLPLKNEKILISKLVEKQTFTINPSPYTVLCNWEVTPKSQLILK